MNKFLTSLIVCISLLCIITGTEQRKIKAVAVFNKRGLIGEIQFTEYANNSVKIFLNFTFIPFSDGLPYHVHVFPVDSQRPSTDQCGGYLVGGHHDPDNKKGRFGSDYGTMCSANRGNCERGDLSGKFGLIRNGTATHMDDSLSLTGINGAMFRSIVIHMPNTARYICATIEPYVEIEDLPDIITASARFYGPYIAGHIHFFQSTSTDRNVRIFVDLFSVDDRLERQNVDWFIYDNRPDSRIKCEGLKSRFNPVINQNDNCNSTRVRFCQDSDLSDKHSRLSITRDYGTENTNMKYFFTETDGITLYGSNSIISRSIVLQIGEVRVGCAGIYKTQPIVLVAASRDVRISVMSYNRYLRTILQSSGSISGIRSIDIGNEAYSSSDMCSSSSNSIFNPSTYPASIRDSNQAKTNDQYQAGDLLGRIMSNYGVRTNNDIALPLSGPSSVANRIVRFTYDNGNLNCVELNYNTSSRTDNARVVRVRSAKITIGRSICYLEFVQLVSGDRESPSGDTLISLKCTGEVNTTMLRNIRFRITNSPQASRDTANFYYNPYMVRNSSSMNYTEECNARRLSCEAGNFLFSANAGFTSVSPTLDIDNPDYGLSDASYVVADDLDTGESLAQVSIDITDGAVMLKINLLLFTIVLLLFVLV